VHQSQRGEAQERLARRQSGVVSVTQLYPLGFSYEEIKQLVARGHLHRLHRGVYAVGHRALPDRGHLIAALLACGPEAFLSHRTAAAVHRLRPQAVRAIHVTVPSAGVHARQGLILHRTHTTPYRTEVRTRFGVRYSSVPKVLLESAGSGERPSEIERLIAEGIRKQVLDLDALRTTLSRHPGHPGVAIVRAASARYLDLTDRSSYLEYSFDAYAETDPRIPPYRKNVRMGPYELDCVFDEQGLVVELDGRPYHIVIRDLERDNAKNTWLQLHGLRILRITDFTWEHDRAGAVEDLLAMLAAGGADQRAA
jgi:hypothetical protein